MSWEDRAACRGVAKVDPFIFFPDIDRGQTSPHVWDQAREICAGCDVRVECLRFQMAFEEVTGRRDGMWGGLTPKEREHLFQDSIKPRPHGRGYMQPGSFLS
jgi:WhiB family redox-sensing transcriptional regulator